MMDATQARRKYLAILNNVQQDCVLRDLHRRRPQSEQNIFSEYLVCPRNNGCHGIGTVLTFEQESQICLERQET